MNLKERVLKLEEEIKKEQEAIKELNLKNQDYANKIAEIRRLKEAEGKLENALKGLRERRDTAKKNIAKQEEAIEQEGGKISEHDKS